MTTERATTVLPVAHVPRPRDGAARDRGDADPDRPARLRAAAHPAPHHDPPRPGPPPRHRRGPDLASPHRPPPHPVTPGDRPRDAGDHARRRRAAPDRPRVHPRGGRPAGRRHDRGPGAGHRDVRRPRREAPAPGTGRTAARLPARGRAHEGLLRRRHGHLPGDGRPRPGPGRGDAPGLGVGPAPGPRPHEPAPGRGGAAAPGPALRRPDPLGDALALRARAASCPAVSRTRPASSPASRAATPRASRSS